MLKITLSLLCCLAAAGLALAEPGKVVGTSVDVKGLVTVSNGSEVSGVADGHPIIDGTRYVTSSIGSVTLKFENCEIRLKPSQSLVIDERRICDALIASIENLGGMVPPAVHPMAIYTLFAGLIVPGRAGGPQVPMNPNLSGQ
jgi:hypothetical protein